HPNAREGSPQIVCDVIANAGNLVDESFDIRQHAVDDNGQFVEWIIASTGRQPLTQIASYDALNLLVDLRHPFLRTHAEEYSGCNTQAQSWNESHAHCRANDIGNFCR